MQQPPPDRQLELFDIHHLGDAESMSVPVPEPMRKLAGKLPNSLFFGTSSWSFPGWAGIIYDRRYPEPVLAKEGLRAYARHPLLRTVGIDRTYYAPLGQDDFASYAGQVPRHFRFVVKAPEVCVAAAVREQSTGTMSPNPLFLDPIYAVEHLIKPATAGLEGKIGALLFQFPPQALDQVGGADGFRLRLESFLTRLPDGPLYAVELRNRSLFTRDYFRMMRGAPAVHCFNIQPSALSLDRQVEMAGAFDGPLIVRWMLHPGLTYEEARRRYAPFDRLVDPQPSARARIVQLCREALDRDQPAYVIINNKAEGSAPLSAVELAQLWAGGGR